MEAEYFCRSTFSLDTPLGIFEDLENVGALDLN